MHWIFITLSLILNVGPCMVDGYKEVYLHFLNVCLSDCSTVQGSRNVGSVNQVNCTSLSVRNGV